MLQPLAVRLLRELRVPGRQLRVPGAGEAKVPCDALVVLGGLERAAVFRPRRLQRRKRRLHMLRWVPFLSALLDSIGLNLNAPLK